MTKTEKTTKVDPRSIKLGHEVEVEGQKYPSKSIAIQELHNDGKSNSEIAKILGIRYQFVYNVLKRTQK